MEAGGGRGALEALYGVSEGLMHPMAQQGLIMTMTVFQAGCFAGTFQPVTFLRTENVIILYFCN